MGYFSRAKEKEREVKSAKKFENEFNEEKEKYSKSEHSASQSKELINEIK
jgi:hypothetical protein